MNKKANVEILQERTVGNMLHIEADVKINGINQRKQFIVNTGTSNEEIQKHISEKIVIEQNQTTIGKTFEVEL